MRSGAEFAMVFYDNAETGNWVTLQSVSKDYRSLEQGVAVWFFTDPNGTWQGDVADTHDRVPEVGYLDLAATANHSVLDYIAAVWQPPPPDRTCRWIEESETFDCDPGCRFDYDVERVLCDPR